MEDNKLVKKEFVVKGRKEPLVKICEELLLMHKKYMRTVDYAVLTDTDFDAEFDRIEEHIPRLLCRKK